MSGRVQRDFRRQASQVARQTVDTVAPAIQASLRNERVTRDRVDVIESLLGRGFWGRMLWLFAGR